MAGHSTYNEDYSYQQDNPYEQNNQFGQGYYQPMGEAGVAWGLGDDKRLVNKVAYGLFAILLGWIGVHKFYAGKTMWDIVYILLSWTTIPYIFGIIEGIIGLTTKDDGQGNIYA